jgi:hypothetical protein
MIGEGFLGAKAGRLVILDKSFIATRATLIRFASC